MFLAVFSPKGSGEVSPDATLMQRLLRRDVGAFEELYERHSRIVYSLVLRILRASINHRPMENEHEGMGSGCRCCFGFGLRTCDLARTCPLPHGGGHVHASAGSPNFRRAIVHSASAGMQVRHTSGRIA